MASEPSASPARLPRAAIQRQEAATARDVKKLAKAGNVAEARTLAKAIVQARTQVTRISVQKARIADVDMQIANMASMARVSGAFEKSTQVMKSMNKLVKAPELAGAMREMQAEMAKMGIVEEIMEETFDEMDDDSVEEAAEEEVEKIMFDLTKDIRGVHIPSSHVAAKEAAPAAAAPRGRVAVGAGGVTPAAASGHAAAGGSGSGSGPGGAGASAGPPPGASVADDLMARLAALDG